MKEKCICLYCFYSDGESLTFATAAETCSKKGSCAFSFAENVWSSNAKATWFTSNRQGAAFNLIGSASFVPDGIDGLVLIRQEFLPRNDININYGHASISLCIMALRL